MYNIHASTGYHLIQDKQNETTTILLMVLDHKKSVFKNMNTLTLVLYFTLCLRDYFHYWVRGSLSETRRGWKFGLTPFPSLRSKAYEVIREILLYVRAQFAFILGHAHFPTCISSLHTTLYYISAITKHAFPTLVVLKFPKCSPG